MVYRSGRPYGCGLSYKIRACFILMPPRPDQELAIALGIRLKTIRTRQRLSQERLAERVGVDTLTISRIETGRRVMAVPLALRVAAVLEVQIGDLVAVEQVIPPGSNDPDTLEWLDLWRQMQAPQQGTALRMIREFCR